MRYLSLSFLAFLIVCIDCLHQQSLDFRQGKNLFRKSVELRFAQSLYQRCNALYGSPSGNEAVRPFLPVSLLIIGFSVFQPLEPAALLRQLLFCVCDLLFQFFGCWHRRFLLYLQIKNTACLSDKR